jgi:quinol monooxygenase YgiN
LIPLIMAKEILSVAIFEPQPGKQQECLAVVRELAGILSRKQYSRDRLFRDGSEEHRYVLARYWASDAARRQALEDPAALRCWARMADLINIIKVYESLEEVEL